MTNHWLRMTQNPNRTQVIQRTNIAKMKSTSIVNPPSSTMETATTTVDPFNSSHVGQVHLRNSSRVCCTYVVNRTRYPLRHRNPNRIPTAATQIPIFARSLTNSHSVLVPHAFAAHFPQSWRRGRDSNPRRRLSRSGFQDRRNRPLCHLSPAEMEYWSSGVM